MSFTRRPGRRGFSVRCFGVGDGWPSADRNGSSFLYQFDGRALLVDCGEPISRSYKAAGLSYDLIDDLLLSHLHFDHLGGFFMLMQGLWLQKRRKPLRVHAPADGIKPIREMLEAACIFDELIGFRTTYHPLRAKRPIIAGDLRILPFPTTHLAVLKQSFRRKHPQRYEAFSFLIESGSYRIGHTADIGAVEDLEPLVKEPLDLLVCELAHVAPKELFGFLEGRAIERILFVHVAQEHRDHLREVKALAAKTLGRHRAIWPRDGEAFAFPGEQRRTSSSRPRLA